MTTTQIKINRCPRCSEQISGWVVNEFGYKHCVMCGCVIFDPGYHHSKFDSLFPKAEEKPASEPTAEKPAAPLNPRPHIEMLLHRCCEKHKKRQLSECCNCIETFKRLDDEEALNEILKRMRK